MITRFLWVAWLCGWGCHRQDAVERQASPPVALSTGAVSPEGPGPKEVEPLASSTPSAATPPPGAGESIKPKLELVASAPDLDVPTLVRSERLKAKAQGKTLVVYAGASWCPPCRRFREAALRGEFDDLLANLRLLEFDADRDRARLVSAGYVYVSVPYFARPAASGKPEDMLEIASAWPKAREEIRNGLSPWAPR